MSLRAKASGRWPGYWVTLLTIWALISGLSLSGCSTAPPQRADGLPIVPRYTNSIQLGWMLAGYNQSAERATQNGQTATLLEDACLGWERAIFDLESARRYPGFLRVSTDSANIMALLSRYPEIARLHPRPAACDSALTPPPAVPAPAAATSPANVTPAPSPEVSGLAQAAPAPLSSPAPAANDPSAASAAPLAAAPIAPADAAAPAVAVAPSSSPTAASSAAVKERQLLARLRSALGMAADGAVAANSAAAPAASVDTAALTELANSEVATIRLRARYHLLGQCVLATELADRSWNGSPNNLATSDLPDSATCAGRAPSEPLRRVQRRLTKSMLQAWRGRTTEPFSDLAIALASFASRDNPNLAGPRLAR